MYLFNSGSQNVLVGLLFVIVGAGVIAALALAGKTVGITVIQRVLLCITVLACLAMPFATEVFQLACSCLVVASWAAFVPVNYAFIVKKSVSAGTRRCSARRRRARAFSALGFLVGWGVATAMTSFTEPTRRLHDRAPVHGVRARGGGHAVLPSAEHAPDGVPEPRRSSPSCPRT